MMDNKQAVVKILEGDSIQSVLGKPGAINERAGDWDIESDELYSDVDRAQFQYESDLAEWKKDARALISDLVEKVNHVKTFLESGSGYMSDEDFKDVKKMNDMAVYWTTKLQDVVSKAH